MPKNKPEARTIISSSPNRRPYAAKVKLVLDKTDEYGFDGEASFLLDDKQSIVRIVPLEDKSQPRGETPQKLDVHVEGFATAGEAEQKGLKLSLALLWAAVSRKHPLRLEYHTPLPCMVYDRTQNNEGGFSISASLTLRMSSQTMVKLVNEIFSADIEVDQKLLVSMELFASARLETTERSRFVGLVSSLEPLAKRNSYGISELENLVNAFVKQIHDSPCILGNIKPSIEGRAKDLTQESIKQAIKRLVEENLPGNINAVRAVSEAYDIRSKILHEGSFDADLEQKSMQIEDIIRDIYARILKLDLYHQN